MLVAIPIYIPYKLIYNFLYLANAVFMWKYYDLRLLILLDVIFHSAFELRKLKNNIMRLYGTALALIVMHYCVATTERTAREECKRGSDKGVEPTAM